ncbi:MAG: 2-oxoglutarate dehydrogenase complex dihydrolipoyllysine-residue succinyltransferase [Flavobacteriales bacterium]
MLLEMKVPSPGESISEVEIALWLVEDGDYVEKDQEIAEVDSDKATLALPAEESGTIKLVAEEGDTVAVGQVVCIIDTEGEGQAKPTSTSETNPQVSAPVQPTKAVDAKATPLAKAIISQNDLSTKDVKGTGEGGKILKEDVIEAMASVKTDGPRGMERKKMSMLRRKVAQRLVSVKNDTAMLTTFNEVDMSAIFDIRKEYKERFKEKYDVSLGFMSFFTKAITTALQEFPDVNAQIDGKEIIYHNYTDISIAVSAPKGLMVPVIRNAELLNFMEVESEVKRLAIRARDGHITPDEMLGGTFTITNGGVFGSMLSTPIINPPQSAILGMHNIVERPVAVNGQVEIRPMMYVALSYDHRIIDGRESVGFLCRVKECLEDPATHLLNSDIKSSLGL